MLKITIFFLLDLKMVCLVIIIQKIILIQNRLMMKKLQVLLRFLLDKYLGEESATIYNFSFKIKESINQSRILLLKGQIIPSRLYLTLTENILEQQFHQTLDLKFQLGKCLLYKSQAILKTQNSLLDPQKHYFKKMVQLLPFLVMEINCF